MSQLIIRESGESARKAACVIVDKYIGKNAGTKDTRSQRHIDHLNNILTMAQVELIESHLETMKPSDKPRALKTLERLEAELPDNWRTVGPKFPTAVELIEKYLKTHGSIRRKEFDRVEGLSYGGFDKAVREFRRTGKYIVKKENNTVIIYGGLSIQV